MNLTEEQQKAVTAPINHNYLITAVAGAGKTTVMAHRVVELNKQGALPPIAITFSKKSSVELAERVSRIGGQICGSFTMHALALKMLITANPLFAQNDLISDPYMWKIVSAADKIAGGAGAGVELISSLLATYGKDGIPLEFSSEGELHNTLLSNKLVLLSAIPAMAVDAKESLTLGDLEFNHILVDEFQDTDRVQVSFINMIKDKAREKTDSPAYIFAVGDVNQSIYRWRGADPSIMINFEKVFNDTTRMLLSSNFRSTPQIIDVANNIIAQSKEFPSDTIIPFNSNGDIPVYIEVEKKVEAAEVIAGMEPARRGTAAIVSRTGGDLTLASLILSKKEIPHIIIDSPKSVFEKVDLFPLVSFLKMAQYPKDIDSLAVCWNKPNRFLRKDLLSSAVFSVKDRNDLTVGNVLNAALDQAKPREKKSIEALKAVYSQFSSSVRRNAYRNAGDAIRGIIKHLNYSAYLRDLSKVYPTTSYDERAESVEYLINDAVEYTTTESYIERINSAIKQAAQTQGVNPPPTLLQLMTVHKSKGLEFDNVYIISASQDSFPHKNSMDIEEERRLMYVAVTRAKYKLSIFAEGSPSPFLPLYLLDDKKLRDVTSAEALN